MNLRNNNFYPYAKSILEMAKKKPIDKFLLKSQLYVGNSAQNPQSVTGQIDAHHIFETLLFPEPLCYGFCTPKLKCVQKTHVALHRLLAAATCFADYQVYEKALRKECPKIPAKLHIAEIYWQRVNALRPSLRRRVLNWLFAWLIK